MALRKLTFPHLWIRGAARVPTPSKGIAGIVLPQVFEGNVPRFPVATRLRTCIEGTKTHGTI
jgi:hypothetical protein